MNLFEALSSIYILFVKQHILQEELGIKACLGTNASERMVLTIKKKHSPWIHNAHICRPLHSLSARREQTSWFCQDMAVPQSDVWSDIFQRRDLKSRLPYPSVLPGCLEQCPLNIGLAFPVVLQRCINVEFKTLWLYHTQWMLVHI